MSSFSSRPPPPPIPHFRLPADLADELAKQAAEPRYGVREVLDLWYNSDEAKRHRKHRLDLFIPTTTPTTTTNTTTGRKSTDPPPSAAAAAAAGDAHASLLGGGGGGEGAGAMPSFASSSSSPSSWPVVVFVHGGGWKKGGRRTFLGMHSNVGRALAKRGYLVAVISYRLSSVNVLHLALLHAVTSSVIGLALLFGLHQLSPPSPSSSASSSTLAAGNIAAGFVVPFAMGMLMQPLWWLSGGPRVRHPDHANDAALAIAWVSKNVGTYGGDPSRICVMGHSAGAHIASILALEPERLFAAGMVGDVTSHIRAFACLSGVYSARLLEDRDAIENWKWWRWPGVMFRRIMFLFPTFGEKREEWEECFAEGILLRRASSEESAEGKKGADGEGGVVRRQLETRTTTTTTTTTTAASLPFLRTPFLFMNADKDWGLDAHTDAVLPLFWNAGYRDMTRITLPRGTDHVRYVLGMDRSGWAGEEYAIPAIVEWLRSKM